MPPILLEIAWPEWLFANPWPLVAGLVLLFAGLRLVGRRLEKPKLLRASWGALGVLGLVIAGAQLVETPSEKLVRQTEEMAQASIGPNFKVLGALLAPEVKVSIGDQSRVIMTGDQALRARLAQAQVQTLSCSGMQATLVDARTAWVQVSIQASGAKWDSHGMTTWKIHWSKNPAGWQVTELQLVNAPMGMLGKIDLRGH